jgi:hypothetical protein
MKGKEKSRFKKLSQDFDEKTNEHVIVIEYRVKVADTMKSTPRKASGQRQMAFLRQLVAAQGKTKYGTPSIPLSGIGRDKDHWYNRVFVYMDDLSGCPKIGSCAYSGRSCIAGGVFTWLPDLLCV